MKKLFVLLFLLIGFVVFAQNRATDNMIYSPRHSMQVVEFKGRMYVIGGVYGRDYVEPKYFNDVWVTDNGMTWARVARNIVEPARQEFSIFVLRDRMWLVGGYDATSERYLNDVWYTEDGKKWIKAVEFADYTGRARANVVVKDGVVYLIGGIYSPLHPEQTVYKSTNAIDWELVNDNLEFVTDEHNQAIVYKDEIYYFTDSEGVYKSEDCESWTKIDDSDLLKGRKNYAVTVYQDKIYLTNGQMAFQNAMYKEYYSDTWYSEDAINWTEIKLNNIVLDSDVRDVKRMSPRGFHSMITFKNRIFVTGGFANIDGNEIYLNDTWCTSDAKVWVKMH